jgi:hypothetical protein
MHKCSTCHELFTLDEMCGNARKKIDKIANGVAVSGEALRCKGCEKEDENLRYWAAKHFGYGANAAKNPEWTKRVPLSDRRAIVGRFRDLLESEHDGSLEVYKMAMVNNRLMKTFVGPPRLMTILEKLKNDQTIRDIVKRRDMDTAGHDNRQTTLREGYIYVHTNPAWPGYAKLGKCLLADKRLGSYQTYSPFRDWEIRAYWYVRDRSTMESQLKKEIIPLYRDDRIRGDEWFVFTEPSLDHIRRFIEEKTDHTPFPTPGIAISSLNGNPDYLPRMVLIPPNPAVVVSY